MRLIPDDPIVASMERTGYPPWLFADTEDIIDADYEEIKENAGADPDEKDDK